MAGSVRRHLRPVAFILLISLASFAPPLTAQLEPPSTGGVVALDQELRMLGHYKRVLMIGAHPDDEVRCGHVRVTRRSRKWVAQLMHGS